MIFARTYLANRDATALAGLLGRANLDLLQLDLGPKVLSQDEGNSFSGGDWLASQLRLVHSAIYLRPELCVVSNSNNRSVIDCVSSLAEFLVAHGSADLAITAVRGDNLAADLRNFMDPAKLPSNGKVLSARLEIGGGPFAAAFAEGTRFVIAGCYDVSAPLLGAAVARGVCAWQDPEQLALFAAASHFKDIAVEVSTDNAIELELAAAAQLNEVRALGSVAHADVRADLSALVLEPTQRNTLRPTQVANAALCALWNARVVVESGFQATALVAGTANGIGELADRLPTALCDGSVKCAEYHSSARGGTAANVLVRIEYRSPEEAACREFLNWLESSLCDSTAYGKLLAPPPAVEQLTESISVPVPAEAVAISVDTRPAREWL
jgi:hypothetical protein